MKWHTQVVDGKLNKYCHVSGEYKIGKYMCDVPKYLLWHKHKSTGPFLTAQEAKNAAGKQGGLAKDKGLRIRSTVHTRSKSNPVQSNDKGNKAYTEHRAKLKVLGLIDGDIEASP